MKKDDYKLGKILATSAIVSDAPLGQPKPKRTKLKLVILAVILGYVGFAVYSNTAEAGRVFVEGDAAEQIIVNGKQVDYWREKVGRHLWHNYIIHRVFKGQSEVWDCVHYKDGFSEPSRFVVRCTSHEDSN